MSNNSISEHQKAIDHLHQMALDGQLIVGSKIPSERELAQEIGISRNSTREAISILRGVGIIESRHGSGNYVSKDPSSSISMLIVAVGTCTFNKSINSFTVISFISFRGFSRFCWYAVSTEFWFP